MWSEEHCYYLSTEAQAWEASQVFCSTHHATLPLLSHTQVRRGQWAGGGWRYRYRAQMPSEDLVQLRITKITQAWGNKATCRKTGHQGSKVFNFLFILSSRGGAGQMGAGMLPPSLWPHSKQGAIPQSVVP